MLERVASGPVPVCYVLLCYLPAISSIKIDTSGPAVQIMVLIHHVIPVRMPRGEQRHVSSPHSAISFLVTPPVPPRPQGQ